MQAGTVGADRTMGRARILLPSAPEVSRLSVASCSLSVPRLWIVKVGSFCQKHIEPLVLCSLAS